MSSQGTSTSKASPKASSGMFTNIQNYVKKNQPQAQKMSKAVQADTGSQAAEIRQAAEQKQAKTASVIGANNQAIQAERDFARSTVDNIMNPQTTAPALAPTPAATAQQPNATATIAEPSPITPEAPVAPVTSEDDMARFQAAMAGNVTGLQDVSNTNYSQETSKAQALRNLAQNANTEQGRKNLLRGTFGDRDKGYSRGMAGLDQLIVGGDEAARTDLIQGIQGQSEGLQSDISSLQQQELESLGEQRQALKNIGADVTGMGTEADTGLTTEMEDAYQAALKGRTDLLNPESEEYLAATAGSQAELDRLGGILGNKTNYANYLEGGLKNLRSRHRSSNMEAYLENIRREEAGLPKLRSDGYYDNRLRVTHGKHRTAIDKMMQHANKGIVNQADQDLYGLRGQQETASGSDADMKKRMEGSYDFFNDQVQGLGSASDIVQNRLAREGGIDYDRLAAGEDIGQYDAASEDQISKANALRSLMGKSNQITEEQIGDGEFTSQEALKNLLSRYAK
jgi:hypothetical protein